MNPSIIFPTLTLIWHVFTISTYLISTLIDITYLDYVAMISKSEKRPVFRNNYPSKAMNRL
ncbi:hypothetical protein BAZMOX_45768_1 [methanotrophic endosymbiont of Bathymodiolus azoricus (Menez Gwen)]|nr:hypothetical protein BAZMOX_45768_1 [methanotrophic endosymbiont of Bathymodiolus azoricus (Menez Gwen)]